MRCKHFWSQYTHYSAEMLMVYCAQTCVQVVFETRTGLYLLCSIIYDKCTGVLEGGYILVSTHY